ncbi:MAG: cyclin-like protein [Monoraphidium minutum]|nr:MAG: cyclin-like protein [Monoraphidium minutum]
MMALAQQPYGHMAVDMDSENCPPASFVASKDSFTVYSDSMGARARSHQTASTSSVLVERPFQKQAGSSSAHTGLQGKQQGVVDIDANNAGNPLACAEYARDIFEHLHEIEGECRPDPRYMETMQSDMTPHMRAILVDWLVEVALEYRLCSDTLHLTVSLLDRFLSAAPIGRDQLQLAGIACMWAAAKYEEIYAPSAREFCFITDNTYTPQQLVAMEATVLGGLSFRIALPTSKAFLRRYLQASAADERLHFLASFLCEVSMMDEASLRHAPSAVAAAAVFLARAMLGQAPWDATLAHYSRRRAADAAAAVQMVAAAHRRVVEEGTFTAIVDKYSSSKLLCVGKAAPLGGHHLAAMLHSCCGVAPGAPVMG